MYVFIHSCLIICTQRALPPCSPASPLLIRPALPFAPSAPPAPSSLAAAQLRPAQLLRGGQPLLVAPLLPIHTHRRHHLRKAGRQPHRLAAPRARARDGLAAAQRVRRGTCAFCVAVRGGPLRTKRADALDLFGLYVGRRLALTTPPRPASSPSPPCFATSAPAPAAGRTCSSTSRRRRATRAWSASPRPSAASARPPSRTRNGRWDTSVRAHFCNAEHAARPAEACGFRSRPGL